eukprot:362982-Chlamydomonas_euryale.AAC.19
MSDLDFGHFCLFGAEMRQMPGWCGDLKHASALGAGMWYLSKPAPGDVKALRRALHGRPTWVASHTVAGEEALVARVHGRLRPQVPRVRSVVVPSDPRRAAAVADTLATGHGLSVDVWSGPGATYDGDVLLVPDHSALNLVYSVCDTVLMANSMLVCVHGRPRAENSAQKPPSPHMGGGVGCGSSVHQACERVCVRTCVRACLRACVRVCVRTCVRACLRACVRAHLRVCVRACVRACVCAHVCDLGAGGWGGRSAFVSARACV